MYDSIITVCGSVQYEFYDFYHNLLFMCPCFQKISVVMMEVEIIVTHITSNQCLSVVSSDVSEGSEISFTSFPC